MRVRIQGHTSLTGINQIARAGRFFPIGEKREVEVLDQEEDPPGVSREVTNASTGGKQTITVADPDRMGQASYRLIQADARFTIHEIGAVNSAIADSQVQAARATSTRLAGQLADAEVEIARLQAELALARAEIVELKGEPETEDAGDADESSADVTTSANPADPEITETEVTTTVVPTEKPKHKKGR
jgi:hypothetical protein